MTTTRVRRQVVVRHDGRPAVQTKPPRADLLWYPTSRWPSVLVRRTHDLDLAQALAEQRWAEVPDPRPLTAHRVGWWRTYPPGSAMVPDAAEDEQGRVVAWCSSSAHSAGPGVEFRP